MISSGTVRAFLRAAQSTVYQRLGQHDAMRGGVETPVDIDRRSVRRIQRVHRNACSCAPRRISPKCVSVPSGLTREQRQRPIVSRMTEQVQVQREVLEALRRLQHDANDGVPLIQDRNPFVRHEQELVWAAPQLQRAARRQRDSGHLEPVSRRYPFDRVGSDGRGLDLDRLGIVERQDLTRARRLEQNRCRDRSGTRSNFWRTTPRAHRRFLWYDRRARNTGSASGPPIRPNDSAARRTTSGGPDWSAATSARSLPGAACLPASTAATARTSGGSLSSSSTDESRPETRGDLRRASSFSASRRLTSEGSP